MKLGTVGIVILFCQPVEGNGREGGWAGYGGIDILPLLRRPVYARQWGQWELFTDIDGDR